MKNQKGVTVTILVLSIVIIAIITGTIAYSSLSSIKMRVYYNMCADIELLDEKIALYYLQNKKLPVIESDTKNISEMISGYSESNVNFNPNNSGTLQKIDLSQLDNLSLNYTSYYIDPTSHTIYNQNGIDITENEIYFTVPLDYQKVELSLYR